MYSFDNVNEKLKSTAILTKLSKSTHKAVIHCLVACYLLIDQANQTSQQVLIVILLVGEVWLNYLTLE